MIDRQTQAVIEAISSGEHLGLRPLHELAKAAIAASDAKYVPMLVEALKAFQRGDARIQNIVAEALSQLPEDLR